MTRFHEDFGRPEHIEGSSERGFGIVFAVVFTLIGLWPLLDAAAPRWWALAVAAAFLLIGLLLPAVLRPLNWLWTHLGILLGRMVAPLVMGVIFFLVVTPIALARRLQGKDSLKLKFDPRAESYWIRRQPPGPDPESMPRQF